MLFIKKIIITLFFSSLQDEDDDDDQNGQAESDEDNEEDGDDATGEDEVFKVDNGPLDPRAGAVDVVLPQLPLDYSVLAEKLLEAGGSKLIKKRNRNKLYALASRYISYKCTSLHFKL